jgi:hypothetical protein
MHGVARAWLALRCNNDCAAMVLAMEEEGDYGRARLGGHHGRRAP